MTDSPIEQPTILVGIGASALGERADAVAAPSVNFSPPVAPAPKLNAYWFCLVIAL
jgi:hypothetical protein